jgi:hypothetical protein
MAVTYADISLINTTFGTTHTFDADTVGAGVVETLSITPSYSGTLSPLMDGGSVRTGGDPSQTSVVFSGTITGDGASNKASDTIKVLQQVLHNGAFKIRFGLDNLELTDCIVSGFTYAPMIGGGTDVMSFEISVDSGAKYFTETTVPSASLAISSATISGTIDLTGFDSDAPTRPIITVTRDGASTVDTTFRFRVVNDGQTKTPEFRWVTAKMGISDVIVTDPFLEQTYIETNNSGVAQVPTRVDGPIPHCHTLLGSAVPQVKFWNETSDSDFTVKVEWYTYRLCYTSQ